MVRVAGGLGPAMARLPRLRGALINIFLVWPGAWCLLVLAGAGPGVSSLPICASSSSGLSLHCPGLATVLLQLISSAHYLRAVKDNH